MKEWLPMDQVAQLQALLDHAQDKLVVVDETGAYRYANDASERILGFAPSDLVGRNAFELMHPEDRKAVEAHFEALIAYDDRTTETAVYRHRTADGDWVWLESRLANTAVADLGGYVVSSRDVTDRKRAERRERRTETRLRELADNAADILWIFSGDWSELLFINDAYEEIWGQSVEALQVDPEHFLEGIHPEDHGRVRDAMERVAAGEPQEIEYRVNAALDFRRWVWVKAQPIIEDGEVIRIVGFARDITDRRRRERQLRVMDNLLRHNIRNDMNVILGHARLARDVGDGDVVDSMDTIARTGQDLLATAAKEREIIEVLVGIDELRTLDVVAALEDALEAFRSSHPGAAVTLDGPDTAPVVALPKLQRTFEEVLENAAEHVDDEAAIDITVTADDETVEVEFRDHGPPIPSNEFEPLVDEAEMSDHYHGTGLGLWLVYWVVDLSDGDIAFSRLDDGNLVSIRLPRPEQ